MKIKEWRWKNLISSVLIFLQSSDTPIKGRVPASDTYPLDMRTNRFKHVFEVSNEQNWNTANRIWHIISNKRHAPNQILIIKKKCFLLFIFHFSTGKTTRYSIFHILPFILSLVFLFFHLCLFSSSLHEATCDKVFSSSLFVYIFVACCSFCLHKDFSSSLFVFIFAARRCFSLH